MFEELRARVGRRPRATPRQGDLAAERAVETEELRSRLAAAEQKLAETQASVHHATAAHAPVPHFRRRLHDMGRDVRYLARVDPEAAHPLLRIRRKLRNYRLAASHGVPIPEVVAVWGELGSLDLRGMPERFVIKSDSGSTGRGVLPLRRRDDGRFQMVGGEHVFSHEDVVQFFRDPSLGGPYFAEELLVQPQGGELPDDIKFYMFYGEVGHVMLRRMPVHADLRRSRVRLLDGDGADLGEDIVPNRRVDSTIEPPDCLAEYIEIARHLSRAVALPFVRVDVYETTHGPMFGELTRGPGGKQLFREDHDRHLARLWGQAQRRLDLDVIAGRPLDHLRGEHRAPDLYPAGHAPPGVRPGEEDPSPRMPCETWCLDDRGGHRPKKAG